MDTLLTFMISYILLEIFCSLWEISHQRVTLVSVCPLTKELTRSAEVLSQQQPGRESQLL